MTSNIFNDVGFPAGRKGTSLRRSSQRAEDVKRVHAIFNLVGFVGGIAAAVFAYNQTSSIALPIFVFLVTNAYIGRGLGDVATDDQKVKRFVYFTLQPLLMAGVLYLTFVWWGTMWLSAILGFLVGLTLWQLVSLVVFTDIHTEELDDTKERMNDAGLKVD